MKNILDIATRKEIEERINSLNESSLRLWGNMNVNQMVCHCSDQLKLAFGELPSKDVSNLLLKTVLKHLILLGMPAPKGKVETLPEIKQGIGGTKPTSFDKDKKKLLDFIQNFQNRIEKNPNQVHAAFGKLSADQWARLCYIHLDHHLKQFGC